MNIISNIGLMNGTDYKSAPAGERKGEEDF